MKSVFGTEPTALIDALSAMMQSVTRIVQTVQPEAAHLLRLLAPLPREERAAVIEALEREVDARVASLAAGDGLVGRLDRASQLFVRVFGAGPTTIRASADDILESCLHGLVHLSEFPARLEAVVVDGVGRALALMPANERDVVAAMFHGLIDALEQAPLEKSA